MTPVPSPPLALPLLTLALLLFWPAPNVTSALRQPLDPMTSPPAPALTANGRGVRVSLDQSAASAAGGKAGITLVPEQQREKWKLGESEQDMGNADEGHGRGVAGHRVLTGHGVPADPRTSSSHQVLDNTEVLLNTSSVLSTRSPVLRSDSKQAGRKTADSKHTYRKTADSKHSYRKTVDSKQEEEDESKHRAKRSSRVIYGPLWTDKTTLFIEMVAIADWQMYSHYRNDRAAIEDHIKKVVYVANAYLNKIGVVLALSGVSIWTSGDPIQMSPTIDVILNNMAEYRPKFFQQEPHLPKDSLVIFTRKQHLPSPEVGKAYLKGICKEDQGSAVVKDMDNRGVVGRVLAHELGHNLGFKHDHEIPNCVCQGGDCIMHAHSIPVHTPEHTWSECSRDALTRASVMDRVDCLRNVPERILGGCGDGVVQEALGEQCDCGPPEFCQNKCCDPNTCRLAVNATCATGSCCDTQTCTPKPPGVECRATLNECDLPEYCSGNSEACPSDVYKVDGVGCNGGEGRCYKGACSSHDLRCQYAFGPRSVSAHDRCYTELNLKGNADGNCGWKPRTKEQRACDPRSTRCGTLHCVPQSYPKHRFSKHFYNETIPVDGNTCTFVQASQYYPTSYWLVPDGASCGDGKMCMNQECRSVDVAMGDCAGGCSGHGVCNNLHHCHCDPGYAPPDCSTEGYGGSIDSNAVRNFSDSSHGIRAAWILPVLLVGALCVVCCLWGFLRRWWKQKGHTATAGVLPCCATCLDSCCCPVMTTSTKWLLTVGSSRTKKKQSVRSVEEEGANEAMICSIDVDVKACQETNSWGVANEKLVTEVVTITPKNSPDLRRKVQLPSNSPVLHRKSVNDLDRPKYMQSISVDSGCGSDTDDGGSSKRSSLHMSMTSLISAFMRFNPRSSKAPPENENRRSKNFGSQKSMPLSRFVVDPLAGSRSSRQGTPPPDHMRPAYSRSFSSDAHLGNKGRPEGMPPPPPPAHTKPHKSEENLLKTAAVSKNAFLQADKVNYRSSESLTRKSPPPVPPSNAKPKVLPAQKSSPPKASPPRSVPVHDNKSYMKKAPMPPKMKYAEGSGSAPDGRQSEKKGNGWKSVTKEASETGSQSGDGASRRETKTAPQKKNVMDIARKFEAL